MAFKKKEPKFKVGDRVRVVNPDSEGYGRVGIVVENTSMEYPNKVRMGDEPDRFYYDESLELAPIKEEKLELGEVNQEYPYPPIKDKEEGHDHIYPQHSNLCIHCGKEYPLEPKEDTTEARLRKLEQEMAELYPRVSDLVKEVFKETKVNKGD
jgi:hypothetical protein